MAFHRANPIRQKIVVDGTIPVSYTHLDVYKRQVLFTPDFL